MNKTDSLLGFAAKAGKLADGGFAAEKSVKSGKAFLVVIAEDASANTRKRFTDMCSYYEVPFLVYGSREGLGHATGKEFRAVLAIQDENLAGAIMKEYDKSKGL